jgi:Uma2 family endonuclease
MSVEEFLAWSDAQPGDERHELIGGVPMAVAPERVRHVDGKFAATVALKSAVSSAGLGCRRFIDGVGVQTPEGDVFFPMRW